MKMLNRLFTAAQGYFELGMYDAAYEELDELPAHLKTSEEVLAFRVGILFQLESWELAREITKFLREASPKNSQYVIWEAYATRRASGLVAAQEILENAQDAHRNEPIVFFNLACYAAQLGNLDRAKEYLARAIELDNDIRTMVLDEEDLESIWENWSSK